MYLVCFKLFTFNFQLIVHSILFIIKSMSLVQVHVSYYLIVKSFTCGLSFKGLKFTAMQSRKGFY